MANVSDIGFRLGYSFQASAAGEGRVKVCHKPTVWHFGTLKYSHKPEEPVLSIDLPAEISLQFNNSFYK